MLWRNEFCNELATAVRERGLALARAEELMEVATELMWNGEYEIQSSEVLNLTVESGCSQYDCEFVALDLAVPLMTPDRQVASAFEDTLQHLSEFSV